MASTSNRGQGGIQQLLAAEQEAQRIVNAAKNGILFFLLFIMSRAYVLGPVAMMISSNYGSYDASSFSQFFMSN